MSQIPEFDEAGLLPIGIWKADVDEFMERFSVFHHSDRRIRICKQLSEFLSEALKLDMIEHVYITGSLVTAKAEPNDFDCLLILKSSDSERDLNPFEYQLISRRMAKKAFGGDVLTAVNGTLGCERILRFFQMTRSGLPMGIVEITR